MSTKQNHVRHIYKSATVDNKKNFILDDDFIQWRLFQTEELNAKWNDFKNRNPQLSPSLDKAIEDFNALRMNHHLMNERGKSSLYKLIMQEVSRNKREKKRKLFLQIASSAAAILIIAALSVIYIEFQKKRSLSNTDISNTIVGQTLPEEEIFILSGKQKINITNNANIELTKNAKVVVTDSTQTAQEMELSPSTMNKLVVPFGRRSSLTLADGSRIWINAGSQIDFPSDFKGKTREITVNGEVFIEVKEDRQKPFIVHTSKMDIRVFGTSFNISAYNEDAVKSVVLVEGSISVKSAGIETRLLPSEKAELHDGTISKEMVDVAEYISWTKDVLQFNETPVSEILKKIGRYYNVQFENDSEVALNDKTCTGKLFLSNNLDSVMTSISHITSTKYSREKRRIFIN